MTSPEEYQNMSVFDKLRNQLVSKGSKPIVQIKMQPVSFFNESFVQQVITDAEKRVMVCAAGLDDLTAADKLLMYLLMDSADMGKS